ncbi:cobyrinate a,c-diamide synthase [Streptomyces sp. N2-109]|uniref:Hydrogenobyrinate a,c-diamide synthase n=1 Tax=Streptomyces gossypii TaxID=2883101 RepID=A0ABT2K0T5_9ACTN|nr:cobyrinate a,c-diamide synthase [Streptomyces gossypii]MCT2593788.1 cobyrinate a,c-diamide synthase [Streptomyces gossypii]
MVSVPRLVIAAPSSGSGKTTVATGLMAAFTARGTVVSPHKVGPDYIDPGYHSLATGRPGRNLDAYLCGPERIVPLFLHGAAGADLALVEGVMGLYDGASGEGELASTAHTAKLLRAPVVLVVDASAQARSVAALVHGFASWDPEVRVSGVILNKVGSDRHEAVLREALDGAGVPVLGALRRAGTLHVPSRHLGLIPAAERHAEALAMVAALGEHVRLGCDLHALHALARSAPRLDAAAWNPSDALPPTTPSPRPHLRGAPAPPATGGRGSPTRSVAPAPGSGLTAARPTTGPDTAPTRGESPTHHAGDASPARGAAAARGGRDCVPSSTAAPGEAPAHGSGAWGEAPDSARGGTGETHPAAGAEASTARGRGVRGEAPVSGRGGTGESRPVVAVAGGPAFTFTYAEHAELLRAAGAHVVPFDPLHDEALPPNTRGIVLGGGFPEMHAPQLAANAPLRAAVAAFGGPIAAECAGLLYLARELDGVPMCGVLDASARMTGRLTLGYREAVALEDSVLATAGTRVRGHEFHRTVLEPHAGDGTGSAPAWGLVRPERRMEGFVQGEVHASYLHLHWAAAPELARRFTERCAA